jgi:hypothetical protein
LTSAAEREASRPAKGTEGPPPARQETEAPAERAEATPETDEDAPGAETLSAGQGGETGPKAAKTWSREEAPRASAEDKTRASAPVAHPTATLRRGDAASTEPTTPETSVETSAEAGRAREPQKPTVLTKKLTPWGDAYDAGLRAPPHGGARLGGKRAPARRERKGGPRKLFAKRA